MRDPQVKDPSARLNHGFASQGAPASRAARAHCPTAHAPMQHQPSRNAAASQPAATGTGPIFTPRDHSPDEMANLSQLRSGDDHRRVLAVLSYLRSPPRQA